MEQKLGLLSTEISLVKKDEEQASRIAIARNLPDSKRPEILKMLRYNMWTFKQFSDITGFQVSSIANKARPLYKGGSWDTDLDFCYPFSDIEGQGPKFIVRNEKSEKLLP